MAARVLLSRRNLLRGGLALIVIGLAGAGVVGYRVRHLLTRPPHVLREELHDQLRRQICAWLPRARAIGVYFYYLDIPAAVVERFLADYDEAQASGKFTPLLLDFYGRFLMSTDFFPQGADEQRPLRYLAFYDPHVSPCYNPLQM